MIGAKAQSVLEIGQEGSKRGDHLSMRRMPSGFRPTCTRREENLRPKFQTIYCRKSPDHKRLISNSTRKCSQKKFGNSLDSDAVPPKMAACHLEAAPSMWLRPSGSTREKPPSPLCSYVPSAKERPSPTRPSATSPDLPEHLIEIIKRSLKGETFVPAAQAFRITRSLPHGRVDAVLAMIRKRGLEELIATEPSLRRDLVMIRCASSWACTDR